MEKNISQDGELQLRYEKYKRILGELTLMSDIFMRNVFKKRECTECVLQVIMNQAGLRVVDQIIQKDYKNLQGRSAVLDCVAVGSEGSRFNVEIQQEKEGAIPKRSRYHSGLLDMNSLEAGQDFDELKETEEGVEYMCREMDQIYQDGMADGIEAGELKAKKETVISLADMGFPVEKIAQAVNFSVQKVQEWIAESMGVIH